MFFCRLRLTIEREITLHDVNDAGILFFLNVTENFTIGHLQEVVSNVVHLLQAIFTALM